MRKQIDFRRGSAETLAFFPSLIGMLMLIFFLIAFTQFFSAINSVTASLETVGRAVSVCRSKDVAEEQAQNVAEGIISCNTVSNILTEVNLVNDGDAWDAGTFAVVTLKAHVDTIEPFLLSTDISKKVLVTVEYSDRYTSDANLTGNDNAEKIFRYFTGKGFSKAAAAGIVGNAYQESGCNPEAEGMGGCGIAGFTPASRLKNQAAQEGKDWRSLAFQLDFLNRDILTHWYGAESTQTAAFIEQGIVDADISLGDYKHMTDPKKAADVFCAYYEQCYVHNAMLEVREEVAEAAYRLYR